MFAIKQTNGGIFVSAFKIFICLPRTNWKPIDTERKLGRGRLEKERERERNK
jgi:hypothetical protein